MDYKLRILFIHRVYSTYDKLVLHLIIPFDPTSVGRTLDRR